LGQSLILSSYLGIRSDQRLGDPAGCGGIAIQTAAARATAAATTAMKPPKLQPKNTDQGDAAVASASTIQRNPCEIGPSYAPTGAAPASGETGIP
jgi:hypothetical protein